MKKIKWWPLALAVAAIPAVCTAFIYNDLPETVPTHFGLNGKADAYGPKTTIWAMVGILSVVAMGAWLLLHLINKVDPKKAAPGREPVMRKLAWIVLVFMALVTVLILFSVKEGKMIWGNLVLSLVGLFFTILGNYMPVLKPNYFAGIRTPWTLESEYNWKVTHQVAGKYWFWGGLLIAAGTLFLPALPGMIFFLSVLAVMVAVPLITSYRIFKEEKRKTAA
jgi:uncharacterized membrane protein